MLKIKDKAKELGVSVATLRRWHKKGLMQIKKQLFDFRYNIGYISFIKQRINSYWLTLIHEP